MLNQAMLKIASSVAAMLLALALDAVAARAQPARVFVAAQGSDANPCTFAAPCRTFQHAHDVAAAGGEIDVLDPAGYGSLAVNKSISIQGHGFAGIAVAAGVGIAVGAGATDVVNLNGLLIDGNGVGTAGIRFSSGQSLTVESCIIRRMAEYGVEFQPNASSSVAVLGTLVASNGFGGISVQPSGAGPISVVLNRVEAVNNSGHAVALDGTGSTGAINVTVAESVAAGNGGSGFLTLTAPGNSPVTLMLFHSVAANNPFGATAQGGGAVVNLAQSMVTGNANGWRTFDGGVVQSYGDNYIDGNAANQGPPPGIARK